MTDKTGRSPVPKTKEMQITTTEVTGTLSLYPKRQHEIAMYQFVVTEKTAATVEKYFVDDGTLTMTFYEVEGQSATVDMNEIELIRFVPKKG